MITSLQHVVMFSGGLGSWAAAKRVADLYGTQDMTLLFTDTLMEDEDLYRFLPEAAADIGAPLVTIADGRTPWQVFDDEKFLGNTQVDPCSKILKRQIADRWLDEHCDRNSTIIYLGIDHSEKHRFDDGNGRGARYRYERNGWTADAPMCWEPHLTKHQVRSTLDKAGIELPRLYKLGFSHNNCGGFCVKGGHGHFLTLLLELPERYAEHEAAEQTFRDKHQFRSTILRDRRGGVTKPLSMTDFRLRVQAPVKGGPPGLELDDVGGCGCFLDDNEALPADFAELDRLLAAA